MATSETPTDLDPGQSALSPESSIIFFNEGSAKKSSSDC